MPGECGRGEDVGGEAESNRPCRSAQRIGLVAGRRRRHAGPGRAARLAEAADAGLKPGVTEAPPANVVQPAHETLAELREWLSSSMQLPLASATAKRILPHGPENAAIMLLSDAPTSKTSWRASPIGGEAWELAKRMLAAIRIPVDQAYSASLSCLHLPGTRMSPADREACAEIARKHIKLARPKRLLLLGDGPAQALLGKPLPQARGHVHKIEGVRTVATFHPRALINQPSNKSLAWKDLLLLMEDEA